MPVTLFQSRTHEILREDLFLEHFSDPQLSSSLHLEPLELFDFVVKVEHHVSLLEELGVVLLDIQLSCLLLLFRRWDHHSFIRSVYLEEDGHFLAIAILPFLRIFQPLILIIGILIINEMIEYMTRI